MTKEELREDVRRRASNISFYKRSLQEYAAWKKEADANTSPDPEYDRLVRACRETSLLHHEQLLELARYCEKKTEGR